MGYNINNTGRRNLIPLGKADAIIEDCDGIELFVAPASLEELQKGKALIVVINNGLFEAAAFVYDEKELKAITHPNDVRLKRFILIQRELAVRLSGFEEKKPRMN